jgi:tape measure domain-containing protein
MATISSNDIKIRYVVETANLEAAAQSFDRLTSEEKQALSELKKFNQETTNTGKNLNNLGGVAQQAGKYIAGIFAVSQIVQFGKAVAETTMQFQSFQRVLDFTAGSANAGARSMAFLVETSNRLGISLQASVAGFKTLSGAASQAGLSNQQTQKVFENVASAVKAFGLSSEDAKGVFLALGQIISKGTVQAEELRGQIGERIPGAFSIAAKSMGVTERELNKMLQTGKVTSREFVIPFTDALAKASEKAAGTNGLAENVNKINNAFDILKTRLGRGLLEPASMVGSLLEKALNAANKLLETQADRDAAESQKAYNEALKQTALLSKNALRAQIQVEEVRLDNIKKQFDALQETIAADGEITAEEDKQTKILQEKFVNQKAVLDAYNEELKSRKEGSATLEKDEKTLKAEYDQRLKMLELLREQRKLIGELYNDPLANIGAEKAFQEAKLDLQKKKAAEGMVISEIEIENTNLQRLNAEKDFNEQAEALRMENYQSAKKSDEDLQKERAKMMKDNLKNMEDNQKREAEIVKEMTRIIEEEEKIRQQVREKAFELGQTLVSGAFDLYQANLSNEMSAIQKRYEAEVRLADGNQQKLTELEEEKRIQESAIKQKQFRAQQLSSIANIAFAAAPEIVKYSVTAPPLAALVAAIAAAQVGFVLAQPVPEFAEGTKGKPFKGGKAIVGERGVEKVVTESGKVYFTPPTATLVDLPKGSQVIPNHALSRQEVFLANHYANRSSSSASSPVVGELRELGSILKGLPITQLNMDERGFEKFIRTPRRSTKILNNRFGINN